MKNRLTRLANVPKVHGQSPESKNSENFLFHELYLQRFIGMLRQITSILLLIIMSLGIAGYYPVFRLFQYRIRQEVKIRIKRRVPENQLYEISPEKESDLEWIRPGIEFRYHHNMYDVVRKEIRDGKDVYFCINDKQEQTLFSSLDEIVKSQMNEKSNPYSKSVKSFAKIFFNLFLVDSFKNTFFLTALEINTLFSVYIPEPVTTKFYPPPKYC